MLRLLRGRGANQAGFTLIELLVVILIVGILAAVGVPLYIGYTRDAKLAEGKALAGSVFTALQACVQGKGGAGANCAVNDVLSRVGLGNTGTTGDNRWSVANTVMALDAGANGAAPTWNGTINVASTTNDVALSLTATNTGTTIKCNTGGNSPPGTGGETC